MNNERIIRVKGRGEIQVRPDTTRISITLEGKYSKYNEVLRKSRYRNPKEYACRVWV